MPLSAWEQRAGPAPAKQGVAAQQRCRFWGDPGHRASYAHPANVSCGWGPWAGKLGTSKATGQVVGAANLFSLSPSHPHRRSPGTSEGS